MNAISRGARNAFRNTIRTFGVVAILGLSIGLALTMLVARQTVQDKITSVKSSIGNTISIAPAGVQGFAGGGEPLTTDKLAVVAQTKNVTSVSMSLNDRLTTDTTNLVSAIEAGSLGNRRAGDSGVGFTGPPPSGSGPQGISGQSGSAQITRTFTPPVIVTGINAATSASVYGGDTVTFTAGEAIDFSKDELTAVVGKALAEKNNLKLGSTFTMYGQTITVKGIFDTGNTFSNAGLITSLTTLQRLSSQTGAVTSATAVVDSVDNLDATVASIKTALGDSADVTSNQESAKSAIEPLQSVKSISTYSLIGSLFAGGIIILLTMMMIVRERKREIGVMKAIGSSNTKTMVQFMSEAITLTVLSMVVGVVIGAVAANPVTKTLVNNSSSSQTQTVSNVRGGPIGGLRRLGGSSTTNIRNLQASVGIDILGYAALAALLIAILGSALPAYFISKIRPADVMRTE